MTREDQRECINCGTAFTHEFPAQVLCFKCLEGVNNGSLDSSSLVDGVEWSCWSCSRYSDIKDLIRVGDHYFCEKCCEDTVKSTKQSEAPYEFRACAAKEKATARCHFCGETLPLNTVAAAHVGVYVCAACVISARTQPADASFGDEAVCDFCEHVFPVNVLHSHETRRSDAGVGKITICDTCIEVAEEKLHAKVSKKQSEPYEFVDRPSHYDILPGVQAIEVMYACGYGEGFSLGSVVKLLVRKGRKPREEEIKDLKKARWYLDYHIKWLEKQDESNDVPDE